MSENDTRSETWKKYSGLRLSREAAQRGITKRDAKKESKMNENAKGEVWNGGRHA